MFAVSAPSRPLPAQIQEPAEQPVNRERLPAWVHAPSSAGALTAHTTCTCTTAGLPWPRACRRWRDGPAHLHSLAGPSLPRPTRHGSTHRTATRIGLEPPQPPPPGQACGTARHPEVHPHVAAQHRTAKSPLLGLLHDTKPPVVRLAFVAAGLHYMTPPHTSQARPPWLELAPARAAAISSCCPSCMYTPSLHTQSHAWSLVPQLPTRKHKQNECKANDTARRAVQPHTCSPHAHRTAQQPPHMHGQGSSSPPASSLVCRVPGSLAAP